MKFSTKTLAALVFSLSVFPAAAKLRGDNSKDRNLQSNDGGECHMINAPPMYLDFVEAHEGFPGLQCQGDCDEDIECGPGLICYQRDSYEAVPGCVGGKLDGSRTDFCIRERDVYELKFCGDGAKNLSQCEGDCDEDSDCEGGLVCYQRQGNEDVPGCFGGLMDSSRTDYCIKKSDAGDAPLKEVNIVAEGPTEPLGRCEGDCDTDQDCDVGLVCEQRDRYDEVSGCVGGRVDASRTNFCVRSERTRSIYGALNPYGPLHKDAMWWLERTDRWTPPEGATNTEALWLGRYVMTVFYYLADVSLQGYDRWRGALLPTEVDNWYGAVSNSDGEIRAILLDTAKLRGELPTAIGDLTHLDTIYLGSNQLSGTIPTELGNLKDLTGLELDTNNFRGTVPTELGLLTKLTYLSLTHNKLTGTIPSELDNLTNLRDPIEL